MFFDCNASFVACALLSTFATITEKERDAVQFIIELIPCYDGITGQLQMTFDVHVLAQIYLAELRVMAGRHGYTHDGSLEEAPQACALLNVIVTPLIRHLSNEEYDHLLGSLEEAYLLLSRPIDILRRLVIMWRIQNASISTDWCSHPIGDLDKYQFGVELPGNLSLEDLLTPLPYPTKPSTIVTTGCTYERSVFGLTEVQVHLFDSNETKPLPQSECAKELEFKEEPKANSNGFPTPFLRRSRGSPELQSEYSCGSGSSEMSWAFANEGIRRGPQGVANDKPRDMIVLACTANHEGSGGAEAKRSRRKRFSHYLKTLFRHAQGRMTDGQNIDRLTDR
ncbi:hypothetical protein OPQ81_004035 [Rhizoctonia solani]|nr:hypothetical protein OPQ81_004035 [Rhizoctonia solani]